MQHNSKLTKTRTWAPTNAATSPNSPEKQQLDKRVRRDTRTSVPLGGRKSGFFAQLFSSKTTTAIIEPPVGSSFVNLSRRSPSPTAIINSIPANLAIRSLSPDLLNDPAFSTNPLSHPLHVTNPDSYIDSPSSKLVLNGNSQAESRTLDPRFTSPYHNIPQNNSFPGTDINSYSPPSELSSLEGMGTNTSSTSQSSTALETMNEPFSASSHAGDTTSSTSSTGPAGMSSKKTLIILEPPRVLSPPPSYDELSPNRPSTIRHISVPTLPSSQPKPMEVPPRPATTANDSRTNEPRRNNTNTNPTRRNRGLDPIDELDESNPLGLSLHHESPYEAIKKVTQTSREPQQNTQQAAHVLMRKTSNRDEPASIPQASVPFGASLNLFPGQILPRNYQPYTQPPLHKPNYPNPYSQRNNSIIPNQQVLRPPLAPQSQQIPHPQRNPPQVMMQPPLNIPFQSSQAQPAPIQQSYTTQRSTQHQPQVEICAPASVAEPARRPSPSLSIPKRIEDDDSSFYGDEANAYGGIEDEETPPPEISPLPEAIHPQETPNRETHHPQEISTHSRYNLADVPQTYSDSVAAIAGEDPAVARALYTVAAERARAQKYQEPSREKAPAKPFSGFSAFGETPPLSERRDEFSRNVPPLPPGAFYKPPFGRYGQQGPPVEHFAKQTPYAPYAPMDASRTPHFAPADRPDAAWHRRNASLDSSFNPYVMQAPQLEPRRQLTPTSGPQITGQMYDRRVPDSNSDGSIQRPHSRPQQFAAASFESRDLERPVRSKQPAPSIQQSVSSTASRNGLPPRHVPSKLTMPQPLYNPNAPPTRNDYTSSSNKPQIHFQPPQHGTGLPRPMPVNQIQSSMRSSPVPESSRVQAQTIPMATDSRKVLRKRSSVQAAGSGMGAASAMPTNASNVQGWHAPSVDFPPTRSKSEMGPPTTGSRMPPPSLPPDRKAPRRLLSKKRAEF
ncbi:hypothetical protein DFH05DRAFT_102955 [Lentinula detonsa]|uniref:Uncharacterized protein n=1 Tax=Lentinula detonsa TaxID=2804962 RepID=A0A9W8U364_9AGAR|nr:hypothetical protein DFH05DRAFT_102955 [Lentinula detonsa]